MAYRVIFEIDALEKRHVLDSVPDVGDTVKIAEHDFDASPTGQIQSFSVICRTYEYVEYLRPGNEPNMMSLECVRIRLGRIS